MHSSDTNSSTQQFCARLTALNAAAVGVFVVRTREPGRVANTVREWAFAQRRAFCEWSVNYGWGRHNPLDEKGELTWDGAKNPAEALSKLSAYLREPTQSRGVIEGVGQEFTEGPGVFVMTFPHPFWRPEVSISPMVIQYIRQHVEAFQETCQRLILLIPEDAILPKEIEDEITMVELGLPTQADLREEVFSVMAGLSDSERREFSPHELRVLTSAGAGLTAQQFVDAFSLSVTEHRAALKDVSINTLANGVMRSKVEAVRKSEVLEVMEGVPMDDIGGMENAKDWLRQRSRAFAPEAREFGVDAPKGMSAVGVPGTGKSLLAKATAGALGVPLIRFDVGRVFGQYVGQSEGRVRAALKMIEAMAPCVVLIDEVDKAGFSAGGSGGDSGVGSRVMGSILTFMQESKASVFWVFTANRVAGMPPELFRKGRLDENWHVGLPNDVEREQIFRIHISKRRRAALGSIDLPALVAASLDLVSAEIEAAVSAGVLRAFSEGAELSTEHILTEMSLIKPIARAWREDMERMETWAENNARPASRKSGEVSSLTGGAQPIRTQGGVRRRRLT